MQNRRYECKHLLSIEDEKKMLQTMRNQYMREDVNIKNVLISVLGTNSAQATGRFFDEIYEYVEVIDIIKEKQTSIFAVYISENYTDYLANGYGEFGSFGLRDDLTEGKQLTKKEFDLIKKIVGGM